MMQQPVSPHPASFRDPSGFIFLKDGVVYRQINKVFADNFDFFISSGCYQHLISKGLLIPHVVMEKMHADDNECHTVLRPEQVPVISYPYEWSFDMLKDAALLTLRLVRESVSYGLILKDASSYNVQWCKGQLIFIDTLSFEKYDAEKPWVAYRQFCEHFLAPLLLAHYKKIAPHYFIKAWPDGIPLDIAAALLPARSKLSLHTYLHVFLNARVSKKGSGTAAPAVKFSKQKLLNIISSLEGLVKKLQWKPTQTTWSAYYDEAAERADYLQIKEQVVNGWIQQLADIQSATDLGANDGLFSRMAAAKAMSVIAADFDALCINNIYTGNKAAGKENVLPLVIDLASPSPANGVNYTERTLFSERAQADLVLALALIHHLCIGKNIPLDKTASFFAGLTNKYLIIEFVSKEDVKVQGMLAGRKDVFLYYTESEFIRQFEKYYLIAEKKPVGQSGRTLYLMQKR